MATTLKILGQLAPSATTSTALYTVPSSTTTVVSSIVVANQSAVPTSFRLSAVVTGNTLAAKNYLGYDIPIEGNETVTLVLGITLGTGDFICAYATLATLSFSAFGEEIT